MSSSELLEQKRKRLAELRAKRAANALGALVPANGSDEPGAEPKERARNEAKTASVAVQTLARNSTAAAVRAAGPPVPISTEVSAYAKAVQTDKPPAVKETPKTQTVEHPQEPVLEFEIADEVKLNEELTAAIESLKIWALADAGVDLKRSENSPIATRTSASPLFGRKPLHVASSGSVKGLFVVLMSPKDASTTSSSSFYTDFPGFAVLYKYASGTLIVRACLAATSELSCVTLDQFNPNKVLGGLRNGRVCVWDLTEARAEAIVLPQLTSPGSYEINSVVTPKNTRGRVQVILPKKPITAICQFAHDKSMAVAFSADGVINAWSTNFLSSPKHRSVQLVDETITGSLLDNYLSISSVAVCEDGTVGEDTEEGRHLDSVLVSYGRTVASLTNSASKNFIEKSYGAALKGPSIPIASMQVIGTYKETPVFVTIESSCAITVYKMNIESPVLIIPTQEIAVAVAARPAHPFQFVSSCYVNQTSQVLHSSVSLWDLTKDITRPAYTVEIDCTDGIEYVNSVDFDVSGDLMYVSFHGGRIEVWSVDDTKLVQQEKETIIEWFKNYG